MALTGVIRPGHVQLRMLDLEAGIKFYRDTMGLTETARDDQGRVYFKACCEREMFSLVLRQADDAGMDFFSFKVRDEATLDEFEKRVQDYGVATERVAKGDLVGTGERVRFQIPSGHTMELYATKEMFPSAYGMKDPVPYIEESDKGIAPIRFDHLLCYGPNIPQVLDFFTKALDFYLTEFITLPDSDEKGGLFLSCSGKAHDIAFVAHPEPAKLHHVSWLLESWDRVMRASDIMALKDVPVDMGPTRHGVTRGGTIYAWDPSGNRFETFYGGHRPYPDWAPIHWTWDGLGEGGGLDVAGRKLHENFLTVVT